MARKDPCWKGYTQVGMKKKNGKEVPNCVPSKGVPKAKGYKDVNEENGVLRYCPKCQKNETRSECRYGPKYWDMFSLPSSLSDNQMKFDIAQVHPANEEKQPDHEHSMIRSELSTIISAAKKLRSKVKGEGNVEAWVQSKITRAADYIDAAADYLQSGEHNVHGSMDEKKSFNQFMIEASPSWQKKSGKDPEGGLNEKGRKSYERENPGSDLKRPQPKGGPRRDSFCARMTGMKKKLTSSKTANDPDSRINKSLRAWNC